MCQADESKGLRMSFLLWWLCYKPPQSLVAASLYFTHWSAVWMGSGGGGSSPLSLVAAPGLRTHVGHLGWADANCWALPQVGLPNTSLSIIFPHGLPTIGVAGPSICWLRAPKHVSQEIQAEASSFHHLTLEATKASFPPFSVVGPITGCLLDSREGNVHSPVGGSGVSNVWSVCYTVKLSYPWMWAFSSSY